MGSVVGGLSRAENPLSEIAQAYNGGSGWVTAAARQASAVTNLGFTATAAQISAAGLGTTAPVLPGDVASYSVLAANSGKLHIIPDLTATCTFTLPTGASGLVFPFMGNAIAADAQNWVFTAPAGVFYRGGVMHQDSNAGAASDELVPVYPNGSSHITLTVVTPHAAGTFLMFVWDGTRYVINGQVASDTVPAFS